MLGPASRAFHRENRRERPESRGRAADGRRPANLPGDTRVLLEHIFDTDVAHVRIREHSRHWTFWHPRYRATTRRGQILLRGSVESFLREPALVLEEYYHVLRQWETGRLTRLRYVVEMIRRGYFANRFEVEAKRFAREHAGCYEPPVALLSAARAGSGAPPPAGRRSGAPG